MTWKSLSLLRRTPFVWVVAIGLAWLTLSVGLTGALRARAPEIALRWGWLDGRAAANLAFLRLRQDRGASNRESVISLSRAAIFRDPTYAPAIRTLGMAVLTQGPAEPARALLHQSARISKRDLPTRLWLIEERVAANDIRGALHHYDIALRTSEDAKPLLFPILARASGDPAVVEPLADLLADQPAWAFYFVPNLLAQGPDKRNLIRILGRLSQRGALPRRELMQSFIQSLGEHHDFELAWQAYLLAQPRERQNRRMLRNGDFERDNPFPPVDWQLSNNADLSVARERIPDAGREGAAITFLPGSTEERVIWQLVDLPPGRYRFSGRAGAVAAGVAPYWLVYCAGGRQDASLLRLAVPESATVVAYESGFVVPTSGCPAQIVALVSPAGEGPYEARSWVDSVSIARG